MPEFIGDLRAISDCVQNQAASAPTTTPARRPMVGQCKIERIGVMVSEAGAAVGLGFFENPFKLAPEVVRKGVAVDLAIARRCSFDRLADADDCMKRRMGAGNIGQVFLVTLHDFQQALGAWLPSEVLA